MSDGAGHHKIFLGMAAGVGKTYRMLQEGHAELEAGRDVVIGYLEPHGRAETEAAAVGLPEIARRRVTYKDVALAEMDLPGLLARRPELALIDELAHTNAPGCEHEQALRGRGRRARRRASTCSPPSTCSTSSRSTTRSRSSPGVRVRETFPDSVLSAADEVVLVDVTPPALIERLRVGKVYKAERVPAALNGFFRVENLEALREVALRQVAEGVEAKRLVREPPPVRDEHRVMSHAVPQAVGERLLAIVTPQASSQRVVRRAWRSAQRLGAELDILTVLAPGRDPGAAEAEQLDALRRLGSLLGATVLVEEGDDVPDVVARVARERGTTYVLMGTPADAQRPPALRRAADRAPVAPAPRRRPARRGRPVQARVAGTVSEWDLIVPLLALGLGVAVTAAVMRWRRAAAEPARSPAKILFPFVGAELSDRALQATLRLAWAERATVVPAYLATVPLPLALETPVGRACDEAFSVFEAIEQRAARIGVPVDARIARGRNVRHALRQLMAEVPAPRGSSSPHRRTAGMTASASTTSPGCCAMRAARSSSSGPTRWRASRLPRPSAIPCSQHDRRHD